MLNKVDEKDPTVKALRAAEQRLNEVVAALPSKQKALDETTQRFMAIRKSSSLELEADALLANAQSEPAIKPEDLERLQHEIDVLNVAIKRQRSVVEGLGGQVSVKRCEINHDRYVDIEKRIARAVQELAAANEEELDFFEELRAAGCSNITFRPMRIAAIGVASDPQSRASFHRREVEEFLPEAAHQGPSHLRVSSLLRTSGSRAQS